MRRHTTASPFEGCVHERRAGRARFAPSVNAIFAALLAICGLYTVNVAAQEQSVKPGINANFDSPVVQEWVERFEKEGREVYDKREQIVELCQIKPGQTVADVGAGTGLFTRLFAQAVGDDGKVMAVDISDEFIDNILQRAKEARLSNIEGVICAPDDAKLSPNSVDVVYICDTYHHFEFPLKTMASIFKALKPDGRVVLVDFKREAGQSSDWVMGHVRAGQKTVREEVESVGFKQLSEQNELLKENYIMVFGKSPVSGSSVN
ncbi:MAG: methyltransferase domain-containing protein [Planctomycetales bacterium]|nr:methyltransferase domain-containing protein [Planctomycetales bacterium]